MCSDALDSALATGNEHDFEPDTPVDGRAEASPKGTKRSEVVGTMSSVDAGQKATTRLGRSTEKADAKKRDAPRPGTEWLDQFSIDEEKPRRVAEEKKRVAKEERRAEEKPRRAEVKERQAQQQLVLEAPAVSAS
jgi:hypothetical protein